MRNGASLFKDMSVLHFLRRRLRASPALSREDPQEEASLIRNTGEEELSTSSIEGERDIMKSDHNLTGRLRAYWLGAVVCTSGFLMGYDTGIVGGVLTLPSFIHDFGFESTQHSSRIQSLTVSLQQLGAFVACFLVWPVTHKIGRRMTLILCSLIFCVGVVIEIINTHSLPAFWVGRVVAGLGIGGATVIVPMYSSEMAPKDLRGQIGCFFQWFFTVGILLSYWVDYGVKIGMAPTPAQWQIPVSLQLVPAAALGLGSLTLKESVRWYVQKGRHQEAWESLKWIRASDGPAVQAEMEEIRAGVELEAKATAGFHPKAEELIEPQNFKLISAAVLIFLAQQATGATAFAYYGPQYFSALSGNDTNRSLLLTGIFGAVKVIACTTFVWFLSERFGRRTSFLFGAIFMAIIFYITAAVNKSFPPPKGDNPPITSSGEATVALIYLFVIVYNMTWGPLPWPYVSEIFPTRIREPGIAAGVSSQWFFNFLFTLVTPYMINNTGWITFLIWAIFNTITAVCSAIFFRETRGKTLEAINAEFSGQSDQLRSKAGAIHEAGTEDSDDFERAAGVVVNGKSKRDDHDA